MVKRTVVRFAFSLSLIATAALVSACDQSYGLQLNSNQASSLDDGGSGFEGAGGGSDPSPTPTPSPSPSHSMNPSPSPSPTPTVSHSPSPSPSPSPSSTVCDPLTNGEGTMGASNNGLVGSLSYDANGSTSVDSSLSAIMKRSTKLNTTVFMSQLYVETR